MTFRWRGVFIFVLAASFVSVAAYTQHGQGAAPPQGAHGGGGGPMAAPPPDEVSVPDKGVTVPMLDFEGRTVVEVKINGKGPYRFLLGTTANLTLIDTALQKELGLPVAEAMAAPSGGGAAPTIVTINDLRMGEASVMGFMGAVLPLSGLWGGGPNAPRGIVSASLFSGYLLTCDYLKNHINIIKGELPKDDSISTFSYSESRPTVPVRIGGKSLRVQLDTGTGAGLLLANKFAQELPLAGPPTDAGKTRTTQGEFPVSKATSSGPIELGKFKLHSSEVSFSDARGPQVTGSLGSGMLRTFVVTIDVWNHLVRFAQ